MKLKFVALLTALVLLLSACNLNIPSGDGSTSENTSAESTVIGGESATGTESDDTDTDTDTDVGTAVGSDTGGDSQTDSDADTDGNKDAETVDGGTASTDSDTASDDSTATDTDSDVTTSDCEHSDDDDNGLCDLCRIDVTVTLDLYVINDLHGKVLSSGSQPGIAGLTAYLQSAMSADDAALLLASGDMWQGSSESNLTKGMLINDWLGALDCVSMTLGNHEFDWGTEYIASNAEQSEFPFLAINVYDSTTDSRVEYCEASIVVEVDGLQVGIIGAIGDCYSSISAEYSSGVYFKTGSQLTQLVREESERLRAAGVDYVVYSIHDGYGSSSGTVGSLSGNAIRSYYDIALSRDGCVDIVFEAHTHQNYVMKDTYGVYHVQGGGDNKGISHAEVDVNIANGNSKVNTAEYVQNGKYSTPATHSLVDALLEKYADIISAGDAVLGKNSSYRSYDYINNLVARLYYENGMELWGDEYDIVLGGGLIAARSPYSLAAGDVTYSDLYSLMPFDNDLVLGKISGYYLKRNFFESTNDKYHIYYEQYGAEVYKNIDSNKMYYIITDTYSSTYYYNHITEVARLEGGIYARDLLAEYVRDGGLA